MAPTAAQSKLTGTLTATQACPAVQSIKKATNPGNVTLAIGTSYKVIGGNTASPTYYWIVVPGATPDFRWVAVTCGTADVQAAAPTAPAAGKTQFVLAASWEPAFCEGQSGKPECKAETATSFEADHFALHGLWPQPRSNSYCSVDAADEASDKAGHWSSLPAVTLNADTRAELDKVMPGTQSALERHEWLTHGTCYGADQQHFFTDALTAMSALNASPVRDLFASHVGQQLSQDDIRAAFDKAFGAGAGERVRIACETDGSRRIIGELTIGITGKIDKPEGIGALILAAAPTSGGCTGGIVDAVGLQ
ncbi:MAG TPA: ribonuclease [Devosia sp.]|nr:ribonuclease [Devosia sp.]